ncbi:carbohydrate ABC transporter permease [Paenibacillus sp. GCM10027626]|uniref:carbohydrate ABC transporter permease n=1 Tax=Paenibacillus sp. GCM10027626 TaxID=3273411 RepID=UPI0036375048
MPVQGKETFASKLFDVFNYLLMIVFALLCLYPFYYVFIYSLSDPGASASGIFLWPVSPTLGSYVRIMSLGTIPAAFFVSACKTILGTVLCVYASSLFAYFMTRKEMFARTAIYRFVIASMYLHAGLIPWYLTMKTYGLKDSFLLYIIPSAVNAFFIILVKTYIESIPASLEESAEIDGAGFMKIFHAIIFPLSKPIVATVAVYSAVGLWNSWQDNFFLVNKESLQTIQLILYNYLNEASELANNAVKQTSGGMLKTDEVSPESIKMTITIISIIPIMFVYPFLQRYFVKGIMLGAVKG